MDIKGIYHADANRYSDAEALYKRCGKSGILLPKNKFGILAQLRRGRSLKEVVPSLTMPSTMVSPTSTWLTTMDLHTEVQRKRWAD